MPPRTAPIDQIDGVLGGPVEPTTRDLLHTAAGGDPVLLRALVLTGLSLGYLVRDDGWWQWHCATRSLAQVIGACANRLAQAQLTALRTLSEPWAEWFLPA